MNLQGWEHDCFTRGFPFQLTDQYSNIDWHPYRSDYRESDRDTELYHVHGELHHYFPVLHLKESTDKPVILNVHDVTSSRLKSALDVWEAEAIDAADAHVWVTKEARQFATDIGLNTDKPYCIVPNYVSSLFFIEKRVLPYIGGVCYEGGISGAANDRDFEPVADALDGQFHIFTENDPGYGNYRGVVMDYPMLFHRLAQHDWGYSGYHEAVPSWMQTLPTKAYEYLAAGIPIISHNTPLLDPLVEMGMGITINSLSDLKHLPDPKPFKKNVMRHRHLFTTEAQVGPLRELYERLTHV